MYSPEEIHQAKEIIIREIALGKGLVNIIKEHGLPSYTMVYNWLNDKHPDYDSIFFDKYTRAREDQADFYADEIIEIADTENDSAKAKVRIDARKWKASKLKPKKYGDRIVNENENKNINVDISAEELDKKIEELKKRLF